MPKLDSTALSSTQYDRRRRTLRATFRDTGRTYVYENVTPEEYAALMAADSKGAWFNQHIRDTHLFHQV